MMEDSLPPSTLAERIRRCADLAGSGDELSRKAAIPRRTLESYLTGESEPKASRILSIAAAVGVSVEWLITGETGPSQAPKLMPPAAIDGALMGQITEAVARLYKEEGAGVSPRQLGEMAGRLYGDVASVGPDPVERRGALKLVIELERKSLRHKAAAPTQSKSSA